MTVIYHYTNTVCLPFILETKELKPHDAYSVVDMPPFVWATTNPLGEPNSSAMDDKYRNGVSHLVRFVMSTERFQPWNNVIGNLPARSRNAMVEIVAKIKLTAHRDWWASTRPVPINELAIETRSYTDKIWRPLPSRKVIKVGMPSGQDGARAVKIGPDLFIAWIDAMDGELRFVKTRAVEIEKVETEGMKE